MALLIIYLDSLQETNTAVAPYAESFECRKVGIIKMSEDITGKKKVSRKITFKVSFEISNWFYTGF